MRTTPPQREQIEQLSRLVRPAATLARGEAISSGCPALDQVLPSHGFCRGALVEWMESGRGCGVSGLALLAARQAQREGGTLAVVDRRQSFYPPAMAAWQLDLESTLVVHPRNEQDEWWALDQLLRSQGVAVVMAWPRHLDQRVFRRLQLAAEASGALGILIRPEKARTEPSWADVRLAVMAQGGQRGWRLRVELLYCRGGWGGKQVELEIDEATGQVRAANNDETLPYRSSRGQAAYPGGLAPQLVAPATCEQTA